MNNQLPTEVQERIKQAASSRAGHNENEDSTPYRSGFFYGYLAGATAEAGRNEKENEKEIDRILHAERNKMQAKISEADKQWAAMLKEKEAKANEMYAMLVLLQQYHREAKNGREINHDSIIRKIEIHLIQWKGKEVENEK